MSGQYPPARNPTGRPLRCTTTCNQGRACTCAPVPVVTPTRPTFTQRVSRWFATRAAAQRLSGLQHAVASIDDELDDLAHASHPDEVTKQWADWRTESLTRERAKFVAEAERLAQQIQGA